MLIKYLYNISVYEAVLPLPTCKKKEGCRPVIMPSDLSGGSNKEFDLIDEFNISTAVSYKITKLTLFLEYLDQ